MRRQIAESSVDTRKTERKKKNDTITRCHLQGPELGHVVETGHGQPADVVVVEGAKGGGGKR